MKETSFENRPVVLRTEGLVKRYGARTVVDGVSLKVHEGEVVGLLGANGAGKTTSFRMTCGLIPADEGTIWLSDIDVTSWPMYRRAKEGRMGYLPQDRSVFGSLTTEKNLYIMAEMLGLSRSEQKRRCEELIKKFRLDEVKSSEDEQKSNTSGRKKEVSLRTSIVGNGGTGGLSGGERRRLEIARALLSEPRIILLDEPFANVDPKTVNELQAVIRTLSSEGIAILITDHQVVETLEITHRSYVIDNGKVLCSGTPLEVLANPEAQQRYFGEKANQQRERVEQLSTGKASNGSESTLIDTAIPLSQRSVSRRIDVSVAEPTPPPAKKHSVRLEEFIVQDANMIKPAEFTTDRHNDSPSSQDEESKGRGKQSSSKRDSLFDDFANDDHYQDEAQKRREKRRSLGLKRRSTDDE